MSEQPQNARTTDQIGFFVAWLATLGLCGYFEVRRLISVSDTPAGPLGWFASWDPETTLPFLVLAMLPMLCFVSRRRVSPVFDVAARATVPWRIVAAICLFVTSLAASAWVGFQSIAVTGPVSTFTTTFAELPPAYHDEYSYLLQAETFAAGRLSWPPAQTRPDLFHQYHVLNEHRTASRYFPWTGAWIALFLQSGRPVVGHWFAGALAAVFCYLAAAELLRPKAAFAAGLLVAVSPGIAIFSNLLLAHHPAWLALSIFLWAMVRLLNAPAASWGLIAGFGLTLAMLGRPMTAAAFGLPWGIVFGWRLIRPPDEGWRHRRVQLFVAMVTPLLCGFAVLAIQNQSVTGSAVRSGYQEYTDVYTPRHTYGFNNGVRGDACQTEKVLKSYDQWAVNLTWPVAIRNVGHRLLASSQWTLGIAPIVLGMLLAMIGLFRRSSDIPDAVLSQRLLLASVVTLHVAHVPYWFDGIMHWHYVFETAPLLLLLVATGLASGMRSLASLTSPFSRNVWVVSFVAAALLPGWISSESLWGASKISAATSELAWSRRQFAVFNQMTDSDIVAKPALILVDETGTDPQLSFIINPPDYDSEVLVARLPATDAETAELLSHWPERSLYRFDPQKFTLTRIDTE